MKDYTDAQLKDMSLAQLIAVMRQRGLGDGMDAGTMRWLISDHIRRNPTPDPLTELLNNVR